MMEASDGQKVRSRRNSNPDLARIPQTVFTTKQGAQQPAKTAAFKPNNLDQSNNGSILDSIEQEPSYFVLRAKSKELLLKMYDTSAESHAILK